MKICRDCGISKELDEFGNEKRQKDGKTLSCKECSGIKRREHYAQNKEKYKERNRLYYLTNKEDVDARNVAYYKKHKEEIAGYKNQWYENNKERNKATKKKWTAENEERLKEKRNSPAPFSLYGHQLTIEEDPIEGENGLMLCRCAKCNEYHYPKAHLIWNRIKAINGKHRTGDSRLYCSDKCRQECDVYNAWLLPRHMRDIRDRVRCHQPTNRKALLDLQVDEFGYNFCEKCGKKEKSSKLFLHHNIMVSKDMSEADNMSHQLICCSDCHEHKDC